MTEPPTRVINVDGRRRRPWALSSREKILAAAVEEIAAVGFERARLSEIAKRANMTAGSVYTWFENKEDLFRAALEDALSKQITLNIEALRDTPVDTVAWLSSVASIPGSEPGEDTMSKTRMLLIESYYAAWRDPAARKVLAPGVHKHLAMYKQIVDTAKDAGRLAKDVDSDALATLMLALLVGMSLVNLAGVPSVSGSSWLSIFNRLTRAFAG